MNRTTLLWIVAGFLVWWFFLRSRPTASAVASLAPTMGTGQPSSASQGPVARPFTFGATDDQSFGPTYTLAPGEHEGNGYATSAAPSSAGATSFPGDDLMSLSQ
jgi:hypothetical protein